MTRVLFIGLDAADRDLVQQSIEDGSMPNLAAIATRGCRIDIAVPDAFYVGAVWPSFYTACAATRHGRYCFRQYRPEDYRARPVGPDIVPMLPFWSALDAAGRRAIVVDVPKSRPVPMIHGVQVCDWGTHDPERLGLATAPASLAESIRARDGVEPVGNCDRIERTAKGYRSFVRRLRKRIAAKEAMSLRLMKEREWDFFAVCFGDSHCVGHQCWHLHDEGHERHEPRLAASVGDPVREIYGALDAAAGRLIDAAGEDCLVFLMCSHGMGRHYDGGHLMKPMLQLINRRMTFGRSRAGQRAAYRDLAAQAAAAGMKLAPDGLPVAAQARSFVVPNNDAFVGIRLNLVGRERFGRIRPGVEAEAYAAELMAILSQVTIGEGGPPAFSRVFRTEAAYPQRDAGDALPDIIAAWSRHAPYRALHAPSFGTVEGTYKGVRTGDHRAGGRLFVAGPGIDAGSLPEAPIEAVGPTICAQLGVPLDDVDGKPVKLASSQRIHARTVAATVA